MKIFLLVLLNILGLIIYIGLNQFNNNYSQLEFKNTPIEIKEGYRVKYIKGEIFNPGLYSVKDGSNINEIVTLAGGFTINANIENFQALYKNLDINSQDVIFIPSTNKDQLFINQANLTELEWFFDIDKNTAQKILSNKPFFNYPELKITLKNLKISLLNNQEIIL